MEKARFLDDARRTDEALKAYDRVLELQSDNLEALRAKGRVLEGKGMPQAAIVVYNRILQLDPGDAEVWEKKGLAQYDLGFLPEALTGAVLALSCGFGTGLLLDALSDRELYLWPRTRYPADWLRPYRPEHLVQLEEELFVLPARDGSVPRPWGGWRNLAFRPRAAERKKRKS